MTSTPLLHTNLPLALPATAQPQALATTATPESGSHANRGRKRTWLFTDGGAEERGGAEGAGGDGETTEDTEHTEEGGNAQGGRGGHGDWSNPNECGKDQGRPPPGQFCVSCA